MISRKNIVILAGLVLSISLLSASVTAALLQNYYGHAYTQVLGQVCQSVIEQADNTAGYSSARQAVLSALKEFRYDPRLPAQQNILFAYGYRQAGFLQAVEGRGWLMTLTGAAAGGILFLATAFLWHRKETVRIEAMTDYLEKVNTGRDGVLVQTGEDAFSKLQDEIYKTVTALHQARDAALKAKENYAENLYNIAHQLKTPITSISLSLQLLHSRRGRTVIRPHHRIPLRAVRMKTNRTDSAIRHTTFPGSWDSFPASPVWKKPSFCWPASTPAP